jgi:hypothetical protein
MRLLIAFLVWGCVSAQPAQWQFADLRDVPGCMITYGRYTYFLPDSTHKSVRSEADLESLLGTAGNEAIQLNTFREDVKWNPFLCADTIALAQVPAHMAADYRSAIVSCVRITTQYDDWKNSSVAEIEQRKREVWIPVGDTILPIKYVVPNQLVVAVNCPR